MPSKEMICAYGGCTIAVHWQFGPQPPIPPEWIQSWLGQILAEFRHMEIFRRLKRVDVWAPDRPDQPAWLREDQRKGGVYFPHLRSIELNAGKATKAVLTHEFGHHVQMALVEELADAFASAFGQIDNVSPAPGAKELFEWAARKAGL